jgi:UDP-N-acetylglucosamine transferase subunit ALG13
MIFITTGSRSFQFDRLLKAVDVAVENGEIKDSIFAQVGSSKYKVKNYKTVEFLNHEEFNRKMRECDIVLTHGGTGVIVNAVKMGKRVIAIPRLAQYQEAVDDHQIQLVQAFEKLGMVIGCYDCKKIGVAIAASKEKEVKPYVSNTQTIIDSIDAMISGKNTNRKKIRILMCGSDRKEKGGMNSVIDQLMNHDWGENYEFSYLATHVTGNPMKKTFFFYKSICGII